MPEETVVDDTAELEPAVEEKIADDVQLGEETTETAPEIDIDKLKEDLEKSEKRHDAMQARIDEMTYKLRSTQEASQSSGDNDPWKKMSISDLKGHRQSFRADGEHGKADLVQDLINEKYSSEALDKSNKSMEAESLRSSSWSQASTEITEFATKTGDKDFNIADPNSAVYKLAIRKIQENPKLDKDPEGHAVAAYLAQRELLAEKAFSNNKSNKSLKKKVDQEQGKNALEGGGRGSATVPSSKLDKLHQAAIDSGDPLGKEWRAWFKARDAESRSQE